MYTYLHIHIPAHVYKCIYIYICLCTIYPPSFQLAASSMSIKWPHNTESSDVTVWKGNPSVPNPPRETAAARGGVISTVTPSLQAYHVLMK